MTESTGPDVTGRAGRRSRGRRAGPGAGCWRSGWPRRRWWPAGSPAWILSPVASCRAGACSQGSTAPARSRVPPLAYSPVGPSFSGTFYSAARRRTVGYTIAYPPRHRPGDELPLVVMLHGYGASHANALAGMSPAQGLALKAGGRPLAPMAMVTVDGGDGYWNPHPGDDPMAMVIDELIPRCQRLGLGRPPRRIAAMGISMGGYGALLFAEKYPHLIAAVAAISPAIWTSYPQARQANPAAYASAAAFAANDAVTHAAALGSPPGAGRVGLRRSLLPRRPRARARPPGRIRRGFRAGLPQRLLLRRAGTAVAGVPGRPPRDLVHSGPAGRFRGGLRSQQAAFPSETEFPSTPRPAQLTRGCAGRDGEPVEIAGGPPSGLHHRHTGIPRLRPKNRHGQSTATTEVTRWRG